MRKRLLAMIFAGMLVCVPAAAASAAEFPDTDAAAGTQEGTQDDTQEGVQAPDENTQAPDDNTAQAAEGAAAENPEGGQEEAPTESPEDGAADDAAGEDAADTAEAAESFDINPDNYVDVQAIDLSLHGQKSGDFTPVYMFDNPFYGKDTSQGVIFEFYAEPTWEVNELGTIFAIVGTGDYDGRIYFTPGSYFGFNSGGFGGYFDANLYNYKLVTDYIKQGAKIRIEMLPTGFAVYANDTLCYDQSILADASAGAGDYKADSDFSPVLEWLTGAQTLYFGYGSWWNTADSCEANINLAEVSFRLWDGTVVFDQLQADKELVERLGGSVGLTVDTAGGAGVALEIADIDIEMFDIDSVEYEAKSMRPAMIAVVAVVAVLAVIIVIITTKPRTYDDI